MLYAISAVLTALICAPFFGGNLLYRDAVASPRFPLTPAAFGIDGSAPRAVPQDAALAVVSSAIDGGFVVAALIALIVFAAGVGYGKLARELVPAAGSGGAAVAAIVGIWNPFVAERLLQGHWSLLSGYAALGFLALTGLRLRRSPRPPRAAWAALLGWLAVAGLTPTGSLFGLIVVVVAATGSRPSTMGARRVLAVAGCWLVTAAPWLISAAFSDSSASSSGARLFALRAESGLGRWGSALGFGGIWNADAVPTSRTSWWALVATGCLLLVVAVGARALWRRREGLDPLVVRLAGLAAVTVILVVIASTGPGIAVLDGALAHIPGAGLLRDSQKYLALAMPFVAITAAASFGTLVRHVPAWFAVGGMIVMIVAPLPDLAWGVGGRITPVDYPRDYAAAAAVIGNDRTGSRGAVAIRPTSQVRSYPWADGPSLSPLPRMIDAPTVFDSELTIDGATVDTATGRVADVVAALRDGAAANRLAALGIGWVIDEDPTAARPGGAQTAYTGDNLRVYRIPGAQPWPGPSAAGWAAAIVAHLLWACALLAGAGAALRRATAGMRSRRAIRRSAAPPD